MDSTTNQSSTVTKIVIASLPFFCCACLIIGAAGYIIYQTSQLTRRCRPPRDHPTRLPRRNARRLNPSHQKRRRWMTRFRERPVNCMSFEGICDVPTTVTAKAYKLGDQEHSGRRTDTVELPGNSHVAVHHHVFLDREWRKL
jgi:hypothetical protein